MRLARPRLSLPRHRAILTLVVLLLLFAVHPAAGERLAIRTFTVADGLGSSFVSQVLQDRTGYLWFATRDGLSRWNGYEFTNLSQAHGFLTPAIDRVFQARSGEYWVIGNDGALYSYLPGSARDGKGRVAFQRRSVQFEGKEVLFTHLFEDDDGTLWGGAQGVLVRDLGRRSTPMALPGRAGHPGTVAIVQAIAKDRTGVLWVGTGWGLYALHPDGTLGVYSLAPGAAGDCINALALDGAGRLWIGHASLGVIVLTPPPAGAPAGRVPLARRGKTGTRPSLASQPGTGVWLTTADGLPDNSIISMLAASDGTLWIGTSRGLARFDGTSFARYTRDDGLCDNIIHLLSEDGGGNLWVATPTGAMRVAREGFSGYTVHEGLATEHVVAIGEMPAGRVYAIGRDWSVNVFDGTRFRASRLPLPADSSLMWASQAGYRDREGRWWALTHQGLYRFPPPAGASLTFSSPDRSYTTGDGLPSSKIFRLFQDRSGLLWVGTRSGEPPDDGLARFDAAVTRAVAFGPADGLPQRPAPSAFAEDRQGDLWVGFYQGGVARYRNGRFRNYLPEDGVPPGMVTALLVDAKGRLWVATNKGGIGRVDDPSADRLRVRTYSQRDGLTSDNVRALAEDGRGRIFAGTVRGLDRLDPDSGRVRHYRSADGLVGDFITAAFRDSRGELWFGAYGGVTRLRAREDEAEEPPPIAVTGLRVAGESYPVFELGEVSIPEIVLDADQRDIAIDFVSVSRHRPEGVSYQYSVDARHGTWSEPSTARTVNFASLPPGRYVFAVRAVTPGQGASRTPATVAFTIRPPIWQRWWFLSLATATGAGLLLVLFRYRVRRLLEMERLRMGIASDLHDDIAANLSSIATLSAAARNDPSAAAPFLERITTLATESVDAVRDIIWSIDPRTETVESLLLRLRDALVASCRARGLHLGLSVPPGGVSQNLTPEQRKNLWLMLKEAVNNAARHSGGTEIRVSAAVLGRQVRIEVRDNGLGIPPTADSPGRGLATMRARAESLGATLTFASRPGEGTTVEVLFRLAN